MKAAIKIVDQVKYNAKVIEVDTESLSMNDAGLPYNGPRFVGRGHVAIYHSNKFWQYFDGEFGQHDFVEDYGFELIVAE
jgi:hypothetical protein